MLASLLTGVLTSRRNPAIIFVLCTAAILLAGLWPFNFHPQNQVEWLRNERGIRFQGRGIVSSPDPMNLSGISSSGATVELLVKSSKEMHHNMGVIFSLYDGELEQFILGQWEKKLLIRSLVEKPDSEKRYHEIAVAGIVMKDAEHLITVTSDRSETTIYLDGRLKKKSPRFHLVPAHGKPSGYLVLGNSSGGVHPWFGSFLGLALYSRVLNDDEILHHFYDWAKRGQPATKQQQKPIAVYLFDEKEGQLIHNRTADRNHLLIQPIFHPLERIVLGIPSKGKFFGRSNLQDVLVNVVGFLPFGFFLSVLLMQKKHFSTVFIGFVAVLVGLCLSLAIELTQSFIPGRDSSQLDIVSNTVGTAGGVLAMLWVNRYAPQKAAEFAVEMRDGKE